MNKRIIYLMLFFIICLIGLISINYAEEACAQNDVYLFYSSTCPHCKNEIAFLKELTQKYPQIKINYMEVSANFEKYQQFAEKYNTTASGVPRTFIDNKVFIGFSKDNGELEYHPSYKAYIGYQNQLETALLKHFNISAQQKTVTVTQVKSLWILILLPLYLLSYFLLTYKFKEHPLAKRYWLSGFFALCILCVFFIVVFTPETVINQYASAMPFPLFVFIIALADGFNPCAFTVLIILLSLLTYTRDKKSMTILGLTFIATSAIMYFIFIMVMIFIGSWAVQKYGPSIMLMLGVAILFAGIINIKDFFFFKKGVSLSISDENKSHFTKRASSISRALQESKSLKTFLIALGGTVVLATVVNIVELGCTAILPAIYMVSLIKSYGSSIALAHILWTLFYAVIYVLPLLAILFNFIYTFKSTRLTERQGRILKLISGLFMVLFGVIMILKPELLMFR